MIGWFIAHCPSRFGLRYRNHRSQSSRCDRANDRTTILAFHLLIVLSHVPLIPTHLTPGSRDAIRRVLAAEEATPNRLPYHQPTTNPQAHRQRYVHCSYIPSATARSSVHLVSPSGAITSSLSLQTAGARIQNVIPSSSTSPLIFSPRDPLGPHSHSHSPPDPSSFLCPLRLKDRSTL